MEKKSGPSYVTIDDEEDLQELQDKNEAIVLGVFASIKSKAAEDFIALASDSEDEVSQI